MITKTEILGIAAVVFSNLIAYLALRRLKENEKRKKRNRFNRQNSLT